MDINKKRYIKIWSALRYSGSDLIHLIYPKSCISCDKELSIHENHLCGLCNADLPYTYFENYSEPSPLDKLFWGRVQLDKTFSLFYFEKEKGSQKLLHHLKYGSDYPLGVYLGKLIAERLINKDVLSDLDALIPVPIHPRKKFIRGYNQSDAIAKGISEISSIPVLSDLVIKNQHTDSQTRRNRFLRWDNVEGKFSINNDKQRDLKHIAIIDDVITTGSTLEALIRVIQKNYPEIRISIISLALAK